MIEVERHVHAEADRVWAFVGDLARWDELLPTVTRVSPVGDGSGRTGARYRLRQPGIPPLASNRAGIALADQTPVHRGH